MDAANFNVRVVRTPFEALGLQPMSPGADAQRPLVVRDAPAKHSAAAHAQGSLSGPVYVGARGLMKLRADAMRTNEETAASGSNSAAPATLPDVASSPGFDACCASPQLLSRHRKGQMMLLNAATGAVEAVLSHEGANNAAVAQAVVTSRYIFTRLEEAAATTSSPMETDFNVYAWDTAPPSSSSQPSSREEGSPHGRALRHHGGRVVAIAAHPSRPSVVASAGLDALVCLWDLAVSAASPVCEVQASSLGVVCSLAWCADLLVAAARTVPATVWRYTEEPCALMMVAQVPESDTASVTALCVSADSDARDACTLRPDALPTLFLGMSDGSVLWCHSTTARTGSSAYRVTRLTGVHRASVSLLAIPTPSVMITGSLSDGVVFRHMSTGQQAHGTHSPVADALSSHAGASALLVDAVNNIALVGTTDGYVVRYDYSAVANDASSSASAVALLPCTWGVRPGTVAVTGLAWEECAGEGAEARVTVALADGTFVFLNFAPRTVSARRPFTYHARDSRGSRLATKPPKNAAELSFPGEDAAFLPAVDLSCPLGRRGLVRAFARVASSHVDIVGGAGEDGKRAEMLLHRVLHEGGVVPAAAWAEEVQRNRPHPSKRTFFQSPLAPATAPSEEEQAVRCLDIQYNDKADSMVILYADGLLQMVDISSSSVFVAARYSLAGSVTSIEALADGVDVKYSDGTSSRVKYHCPVPAFN